MGVAAPRTCLGFALPGSVSIFREGGVWKPVPREGLSGAALMRATAERADRIPSGANGRVPAIFRGGMVSPISEGLAAELRETEWARFVGQVPDTRQPPVVQRTSSPAVQSAPEARLDRRVAELESALQETREQLAAFQAAAKSRRAS